MAPPASPQLVHLDAQGQGILTCPQCRKKSRVSGVAHRDLHEPVWDTWDCGHRFPILFNTRHFYRKAVHLPGRYMRSGSTTERRMIVVNLSMIGVHFHTLLPHLLQPGDIVELAFHLDDQRHSEIRPKVMIQWVDDKQVGAEFCDLRAYIRTLGFYFSPA